MLAGIAIATLTVARVGQPVLVQLWGVQQGLAEAQISLIIAVGAGIEIVLMGPGGVLKDTLGRAPILIACLTVYGAGLLLLPWAHTWTGIAAAVAVMAVGNGLGAGVNMTIGADLSPRAGRARFLGVWALFSNVGVLGGPALIALLVGTASLSAAVWATGGLALAGAVWMATFARTIDLPRGVRQGGH